MSESDSRSLHLHTLESLVADLISGRSVEVGNGKTFKLVHERSRSALEWYRKKGAIVWSANLSAAAGEELVNAILLAPPTLPALPARAANSNSRRLRLKKLEAHRFAGLHKFGTPDAPPQNYVHEFTSSLTLLEGRNGSGKTSLLNAIIWALTGEMLRPQRGPEKPADFDCLVAPENAEEESSTHKLSPLTPMPNIEQYRPEKDWIPADTWVELTFVDENARELPVIRRSQSRSVQGKLKETEPDLSVLKVDPIAIRIGTVMPGLLPLIKVGSESELGLAVSQLTGLSALIDLAEHGRRAKNKIEKEFVKSKTGEQKNFDTAYVTAKTDLEQILVENPELQPSKPVPAPSNDNQIEQTLKELTDHFIALKAKAFTSARDVLGEGFDPASISSLTDLEKNVGGAIERVRQPGNLASAATLGALRKLPEEQLEATEAKIRLILDDAAVLQTLAKDQSLASRKRLYARVATWMSEHLDASSDDDACVVCGGSLVQAVDQVTGKLVKVHLHEAASDGKLVSQTLAIWAENAEGSILKDLPETLLALSKSDLPEHPCDLLKSAITNELFTFEPFKGVLGVLKATTSAAFDEVIKDRMPLAEATKIILPTVCASLARRLERLDRAIRFARWRQDNDDLVSAIISKVLGRIPKEGETPSEDQVTLSGKLLALQSIVKASKPISDALLQCERLSDSLTKRRATELRIKQYEIASTALADVIKIGSLADKQVDQLRQTLRTEAALWRNRIYLGAFPDTAHELVDTSMGRKGELGLMIKTGGVSAPAQHVTNASALRASLVAFYLAFWEYVLKERGGLTIIALDDPQELLDDSNRERLAASLIPLVAAGAQLVVTSHDSRFCTRVSRLKISGHVEHYEVVPATRLQPVVRINLSRPIIEKRKLQFEADPNDEESARLFADGCRVFLEAKLGDMFDDPAHSAWVSKNPDPTLATFIARMRGLVKSGPTSMFSAHVFQRFVDHAALADGSNILNLMNKSHHGRRQEIQAAEVALCSSDLSTLLELAEQMYEECYRWRRRDQHQENAPLEQLAALEPMNVPELQIHICPDLAAFTQHAVTGDSQESTEMLDPSVLNNKAAYYLRRENFGFAAPMGAVALVEAIPGPAADRRLAIARQGDKVYARRFLKGTTPGIIGLTAEVLDPRTRSPKTLFLSENEVAIHQVTGIIFDHNLSVGQGQEEAVLVDVGTVLKRAEIAFRVKDDSAVPLALEKQVLLGGPAIDLAELSHYEDRLVALSLDDGSSLFKRVGRTLPGELSFLRQFESIGGLGSSQILSVGKPYQGLRAVQHARVIFGILYHA